MTLYLDTEFNGFGGRLISMALVSSKGGEFYGVLPLPSKVHPWVAEHVVPFLMADAEDEHRFNGRLLHFLKKHNGEYIIADWPEDFTHLLTRICGPGGFMQNIELHMSLVQSGPLKPEIPHNALSDARALMKWHMAERPEGVLS